MYPKIENLTQLDRISHTGLSIEERACVTVHSGRRFSIIAEKLFSFFTRPPQCPRDCFSHSVTRGSVGVHVRRPIQKKSRTYPLLYDIMSTMPIYSRRCSFPSPGELNSQALYAGHG